MKTLKPLFLPAILLLLFISGCTFTSTRSNREEDKKDAEKIVMKFFDLIKLKKTDAIYPLFSAQFLKVTPKDSLKEIIATTQDKLGDLEDIKLDDWETKVVSGTDPSAEYRLLYKNHRKKYDSKETFVLIRDDDGKLRIISYHVSSKGFGK